MRGGGCPSFSAAIETDATRDTDTSPFAQRIPGECKRCGFDVAASWIWSFVQEHYLKAIFGGENDRAKQWAGQRWSELDESRIDKVLAELVKHAARCREAVGEVGYFTANRNRMRYPNSAP